MRRRVPPLTEHCEHGLFDAEGGDLNVHAILQGYRRQLRQNGADLRVDAEVMAVTLLAQGWEVGCANGLTVRATKVVNAAGAWADDIGQLAGLPSLGLIPKRRTACLVQPQADWNVDEWPMLINIDEEVYFKSEAGQLMVSPRMRRTLFLAMCNQKKLMSPSPSIATSRLSIIQMQHPRIRGQGCGPSHLIAPLWLDQTQGSRVLLARRAGWVWRSERAGDGKAGNADGVRSAH